MKTCSVCNIKKPLKEFMFRNDTKKYRNSCKKCDYKRYQKYRKENPWYDTLSRIKNRCRNNKYYKNIKCNITAMELKNLWLRDNAWDMENPSIDRIDAKGNYEYSNCRYIECFENNSRAHKGKTNLIYNIHHMKLKMLRGS